MLAHEFGHLAGAHGRFGAWVYRLRASWSQLLERLAAQRRFGTAVFRRFAAWYAPVFDAYSFVQARMQEVEADRMSAEIGGARSAGDALVRMVVAGQLSDEFWQSVQARVRREPDPPDELYSRLGAAVAGAPDPECAGNALERALAARTSSADTHPCLRDRLAALAVEPRLPGALDESAARALLGAALPRIAQQLSGRWRAAIEENWRKAHASARAERERLAELDAEWQRQPLAPERALERAALLGREGRRAEAEAALERLATEAPDFEPAQRALGESWLARGDERGLALLERALALGPDPAVALVICWTALHFLRQRGRSSEAEPWAARARQQEEASRAARAERGSFDARVHPITAHGLDARAVAALVGRIQPLNALRDAWLAQRVLRTPGPPMYVLGVRMRGPLPGLRSRAAVRLRHAVATEMQLDARAFCMALDLLDRRTRRRFMKTSGPPVYRHS